MGANTLNNRAAGETILDTFFNDIHQAMNGDMVGRNTSGVPTSGQSLGTVALPWGTVYANSVVLNGASVDTSQITSPVNRLVSGKKRSTSNQPAFITPNGAALSFILAGATTNLVTDINGTTVTVSTDITKSSLTAAPSSNNTCLSNDADAADQEDTRLWGEYEHNKVLTVDTMGTEIQSMVGKYAAFKLDNGSATEYFLGYVDSTTQISKCRRGFFYDSSLNPKNRIVFSNNDTITLMKLGWVFITNDGTTVDVSYTVPTWSFTAPTGPATGDYWYDFANSQWKRYDGASWQIISRVLIGMVVNDSTNCVAARCMDFYAEYDELESIEIEVSTTAIAKVKNDWAKVDVKGNKFSFNQSLPSWNITTDLAGSTDMYDATEQASRVYYLYIKDTGAAVISDISPYYRWDFGVKNNIGLPYHPHNPWRCVGVAYNSSGSNIVQAGSMWEGEWFLRTGNGYGSTKTYTFRYVTTALNKGATCINLDSATLGQQFICVVPGWYEFGATATSVSATGNGGVAPVVNTTNAEGAATYDNIQAKTRGHSYIDMRTANEEAAVQASGGAYLRIGDVVSFLGFNNNATLGAQGKNHCSVRKTN
jgi:hypothetical protein